MPQVLTFWCQASLILSSPRVHPREAAVLICAEGRPSSSTVRTLLALINSAHPQPLTSCAPAWYLVCNQANFELPWSQLERSVLEPEGFQAWLSSQAHSSNSWATASYESLTNAQKTAQLSTFTGKQSTRHMAGLHGIEKVYQEREHDPPRMETR